MTTKNYFVRFAPVAARVTFAPLAVFRDSRFAAPLALSAAILMQHHFFQELSELALAAANSFSTTGRRSRACKDRRRRGRRAAGYLRCTRDPRASTSRPR